MKAKKIYYEKCFNLGNYQNEKVGIEIELEEDESVQSALLAAKQFVEANSPRKTEVIESAKRTVANPNSYSYGDVMNAKEILENQPKIDDLPF